MSQSGYPAGTGQAAPPKKKSYLGCVLGGCGGCLVMVLAICGLSGFLLYLEEGTDYDEPGEEVASVPVVAGQPFQISYVFDGTGYAHHDFWLEVTGVEAFGDFAASGTIACDHGYGSQAVQKSINDFYGVHDLERRPDGTFTAWIQIHSEYDRSSSRTMTCSGTLQGNPGQMVQGRVVLTRKQRPSDWLAAF